MCSPRPARREEVPSKEQAQGVLDEGFGVWDAARQWQDPIGAASYVPEAFLFHVRVVSVDHHRGAPSVARPHGLGLG